MINLGLKLGSRDSKFTDEILKYYEQGVFQYIELFTLTDTYSDTISYWKQFNIPFGIHAPHSAAGLNLANVSARTTNKEKIQEAVRFADELKAQYIIFHSGVNGMPNEVVQQLSPFADERFLIENKPIRGLDGSTCVGSIYSDLKLIIDGIGKGTGFCLDFGHAICAARTLKRDPMEFINELLHLRPRVYHLTDGDFNSELDSHLHYGTGSFPLKELLKLVPNDGMVTNEAKRSSLDNLEEYKNDSDILNMIIKSSNNPVENIEYLVNKYFGETINIKNKSLVNCCISALVDKTSYREFSFNFEERLKRLSKKITDKEQRKQVVEKIKNIAEKTGYKWSGAYSELVALDYFLDSDYLMNHKFINIFNASDFPCSLPARNGRKTIDIDMSFDLRENHYFTDVKSLIPTQIEILDTIIEDVSKKNPNVLIAVNNYKPESIIDFQNVIENEKNKIKDEIIKGIETKQTHISYTTEKGFVYEFVISYKNVLSAVHVKSSYELAKKDKYKYLNYHSKLLNKDYSFLTFVVNSWFNRILDSYDDFDQIYYRSVSRRVFMEFKNDKTLAKNYFKDIKDTTITVADISTSIAGILFIEDKSVKGDGDGLLYKSYFYLNPNYKWKKALTERDFASAFSCSTFSELSYIDDFQDDNY